MNGVVLWSCPETWRAIVWCEDHAQLAYARGREAFVNSGEFPGVGDLIAFEVETQHRERRCRSIRVVLRDGFPEIADSLRNVVGGLPDATAQREPEPVAQAAEHATATVLSFSRGRRAAQSGLAFA